MFTSGFKQKVILSGSVLLASMSVYQSALAHGIYATERQSENVFVYGHGPSDELFETEKYKGAVGYDKDGNKIDIETNYKFGYPVIPENDAIVLVSAAYDNGYWSQQPDEEWVNLPKTEVEGALKGGHYMKYSTTIMSKDYKGGTATNSPLEIVPLKNPLSLKQGDKLEIQVLADGKPVADVEVASEFVTDREKNVVKTDDEGKATITIRNLGLNVLATEAKAPLENSPKADELAKFATLSFTFRADH